MVIDYAIVHINITCIAVLLTMMVILTTATRMKNGAGYAALLLVTTTVPVYLSNLMRTVNADMFLISMYPAVFLNALCFPSLYIFVRSQLDRSFRFTYFTLLHLLPAVISLASALIYYSPMSVNQVAEEREFLEAGNENIPAIINDVIVFGQYFIYFTWIFIYVRFRKKELRDNYADSDYLTTGWLMNFLLLFFILFFIVFVAYVINPRTDAWLIPVLNTVGMVYLVYNVIYHSTVPYIKRLTDIPLEANEDAVVVPVMSDKQMSYICGRITDYLVSSRAYRRKDLSLSMLSKEVGIPQKTLSRSINGHLNRNFFELINEFRIEEAKQKLLALEMSDYKIDSIYEDCGFRTRSTFFLAFKKLEGKSPAQWLAVAKKRD